MTKSELIDRLAAQFVDGGLPLSSDLLARLDHDHLGLDLGLLAGILVDLGGKALGAVDDLASLGGRLVDRLLGLGLVGLDRGHRCLRLIQALVDLRLAGVDRAQDHAEGIAAQ